MSKKLTDRQRMYGKGKTTVKLEPTNPLGNDRQVALLSTFRHEDRGGMNEHLVEMYKHEGGSVALSEADGGDGFIYLYPQQVRHLKILLARRLPRPTTVERTDAK